MEEYKKPPEGPPLEVTRMVMSAIDQVARERPALPVSPREIRMDAIRNAMAAKRALGNSSARR